MDELGLEVPDEYIRTADYLETKEAARQTRDFKSSRCADLHHLPDDTALIGGRNVIIEMGLRIPRDISVAGYDGTRISQLLHQTYHNPSEHRADWKRSSQAIDWHN